MSRYLARELQALAPYTPGEQPQDQRYIKLNTNENPYPPAPGVMAAINRSEVEKLRLYSDPTCKPLIDAIAEYYRLDPERVFVGNSSDEVLAFSFLAFCDDDREVAFPEISYGFYKVFAGLFACKNALQIPLEPDLTIDPGKYCGIGRTIFIANPNAPTGLLLSVDAVERIVASNPDNVVVIDEAYADFAEADALSLIDRYENLLIVRTFSKSRALAGARLGYALAQKPLIDDLMRVKFSFNPYNVNRLTMLAGTEAMKDDAYFRETTKKIIATRDDAKRAFRAMSFTVTDSQTNFLFVQPPDIAGEAYYQALKARGILVRYFGAPERIRDFVRVSIGTDAEMRSLIEATKDILKEA